MSEYTWNVSGLVVVRGEKSQEITVPKPLLIFDAIGFARWLSALHYEDALLAEAAGKTDDADLSRTVAQGLVSRTYGRMKVTRCLKAASATIQSSILRLALRS
jgi:hypothetical protein